MKNLSLKILMVTAELILINLGVSIVLHVIMQFGSGIYPDIPVYQIMILSGVAGVLFFMWPFCLYGDMTKLKDLLHLYKEAREINNKNKTKA